MFNPKIEKAMKQTIVSLSVKSTKSVTTKRAAVKPALPQSDPFNDEGKPFAQLFEEYYIADSAFTIMIQRETYALGSAFYRSKRHAERPGTPDFIVESNKVLIEQHYAKLRKLHDDEFANFNRVAMHPQYLAYKDRDLTDEQILEEVRKSK